MKVRLVVVLLLLCLFAAVLPGRASGDCPTFAVIGDTKIGATEGTYRRFLSRTDRDGTCFFIIVGDVIDRPGNVEEWNRFLALTGPKREYHIAIGNHDVNTAKSLRVYREVIGKPPYYSFSKGDSQFIILATELPGEAGRITGNQRVWLEGELKKPFAHRFVFLHRPPFPSTFGQGYGLDRHPRERDALHDLLRSAGVKAVFAGHEHLYHKAAKDGVTYVITGGGGARLLTFTEEYGGYLHYILANRVKDGYLFTVYDMNGNVRDQFSLSR